jgi:hypothetical protein
MPLRYVPCLLLDLDNANPNVGMGMWSKTAVDEAIRLLGYTASEIDVDHVCSDINKLRKKRGL